MMTRMLTVAVVAVLALALHVPAPAQMLLASSAFDSDVEDWQMQSLGEDFSILVDCPEVSDCIYGAIYESAGGNPGGYLSMRDSTSNVEFWRAPEAFVSAAAMAYGGELRFDIVGDVGPTGGIVEYHTDHDVILFDETITGIKLFYDLPYPPEDVWTTRSVPLLESAGWVNENTGTAPTQAEMEAVLTNLDHFWILAEYYRPGMDLTGMDNVLLYGPGGSPAELTSWARVKALHR